jgi:hypothetical protein
VAKRRHQDLTVRFDGHPKATLRFGNVQPILTQFVSEPKIRANADMYLPAHYAIEDLKSMKFLELSPDAMRIPSVPGQSLGDRGEHLSSVLQTMCEPRNDKQVILEWIRQLTPLDVEDLDFVQDQTGKILLTLVERGGRRISAYSASDGTLRFLALIAAILGPDTGRVTHLKSRNKPWRFYFIEELDTGIHPTRLHLLMQLIEHAAAGKYIQVVATTHSPQLLSFLGESSREAATLVYRLPHHGEARLRRILDIPEAKQILAKRSLNRLHESGWLENAVTFLEGEPDGQVVQS